MLLKRSNESHRLLETQLKAGRIVVMACDTIYGIVGRVPDTDGSIRRIKGRGETQPFLQLLSDSTAIESSGAILPQSDILTLWPGPFTFIFLMKDGGTTAFRVPEDSSLRSLIREVASPLYSTSVNRTGEPPLYDPADIESEFGNALALVEDSGRLQGRQPSTVVDLTVRPYRILRQGAGVVPERFLIF
jgi:L-threonylcarbamoyladenylate synthase